MIFSSFVLCIVNIARYEFSIVYYYFGYRFIQKKINIFLIFVAFQELLADIVHFQLSEFQKRWKLFWRSSSDGTQPNGIEQCEYDNILPK